MSESIVHVADERHDFITRSAWVRAGDQAIKIRVDGRYSDRRRWELHLAWVHLYAYDASKDVQQQVSKWASIKLDGPAGLAMAQAMLDDYRAAVPLLDWLLEREALDDRLPFDDNVPPSRVCHD